VEADNSQVFSLMNLILKGPGFVSVAIKNALENLDRVIDRLEGSALSKQLKAPKMKDPDLFSAAPASTVVNFDRNALAKKLDMTIARVEQLLEEA
jgi:hypothetical protein